MGLKNGELKGVGIQDLTGYTHNSLAYWSLASATLVLVLDSRASFQTSKWFFLVLFYVRKCLTRGILL
jgi:hypothetical protein